MSNPEFSWTPPPLWAMPVKPPYLRTKRAPPLSAGFHLMLGARATGKTLTALALALQYKEEGIPTLYHYVMEPRASRVDLAVSGWDEHLREGFKVFTRPGDGSVASGVMIEDSMTYTISALQKLKDYDSTKKEVTFKGGLSPRDILGVMLHDSMAKAAGVALIGTVNSDLFPVAGVFEGACEGELQLLHPGEYTARDRRTRQKVNFKVPAQYIREAARILGYDQANVDLATDIA